VWKIDFIEYLCEICLMFENMVICVKMWLKIWPFDVLILFLKCIQFLMDTIPNLAIVQLLMKIKRHAHQTCVSYLNKMEMCFMGACLLSKWKGDARYVSASPFYLTPQKRLSTEYSLHDAHCTNLQRCPLAQICNIFVLVGTLWAQCKKHRVEHKLSDIFEALRLSWI
jgi:hypothetical protein